jgi:hypothetical protein
MAIAIVSLLLSIIAVGISLTALRHSRRQTQIMEAQEVRRQEDGKNVEEWSRKFDAVVRLLLAIEPKSFNDSRGRVFVYIFPEGDLRTRIETYLIEADLGRNHFKARSVSPEVLLMPIVQQTIQQVLDGVEEFRQKDPVSAARVGLG